MKRISAVCLLLGFVSGLKGSVIQHNIRSVRFVRPDAAIVYIETEITGYKWLPPGVAKSKDHKLRTSMLQVMVKDGGDWWVEAFHNIDVKAR